MSTSKHLTVEEECYILYEDVLCLFTSKSFSSVGHLAFISDQSEMNSMVEFGIGFDLTATVMGKTLIDHLLLFVEGNLKCFVKKNIGSILDRDIVQHMK